MSEFAKRVLMTIVGVTVGGFSVGMFSFSAFGTDPFQVLAHGIWYQTNLDFGTLYMIVNLIMLVGVFLLINVKSASARPSTYFFLDTLSVFRRNYL